jgi:hypothetical protein
MLISCRCSSFCWDRKTIRKYVQAGGVVPEYGPRPETRRPTAARLHLHAGVQPQDGGRSGAGPEARHAVRLHEAAFEQIGGGPEKILYRMKTVWLATDERGESSGIRGSWTLVLVLCALLGFHGLVSPRGQVGAEARLVPWPRTPFRPKRAKRRRWTPLRPRPRRPVS